MTIASNNRITSLESRVSALEQALQILLRAERAHESAPPDLDDLPVIAKLKNEIQGIKMRMGKQ